MKVVKKLVTGVVMAAICCSMVVPMKAKADICPNHRLLQNGGKTTTSTMHHGYSVGTLDDPKYMDCLITTTTVYYYFECPECHETLTTTQTETTHSSCGL